MLTLKGIIRPCPKKNLTGDVECRRTEIKIGQIGVLMIWAASNVMPTVPNIGIARKSPTEIKLPWKEKRNHTYREIRQLYASMLASVIHCGTWQKIKDICYSIFAC